MNIIYTLLLAFPLGYFIHSRAAASGLCVAGSAFVLAFQSVNLLVEWVDGSTSAFGGPFPDGDSSRIFGYGLVNLAIAVIGIGVVLLGARVADKRAHQERPTVSA